MAIFDLALGIPRASCGEPPETELAVIGKVAIVRTPPRIAIETRVRSADDSACDKGLRRLRAYLEGGNRARTPLATAGLVIWQRETARLWRIRIHLPPGCEANSLPVPLDPKVRIVTVPTETLAILRSPVRALGQKQARCEAELRRGLTGSNWIPDGRVRCRQRTKAGLLAWFRRNELAIPVRHTTSFA